MIIPVFEPGSLSEYIKLGKPQAPRPSVCPNCQARQSFWRHDRFERWAIEGALEARIRIQRFLCHACGQVVSCLFAFLVPYRQATAVLVARAVSDYSTTSTTYRQEAGELSALDSLAPPKPSHSQVFRWVEGICNKVGLLLLQVQKELLMGQRADDVQEMIGAGCPNAVKAHSMHKARSLNELAELVQLASLLVGGGPLSVLQTYFLSQVESLQAIFSNRSIRLATPQKVKHVVF